MKLNTYKLLGDFDPDYLVTRYFSKFDNPVNTNTIDFWDESNIWESSYQVENAASFVHESTHYLQFISTTFGLSYHISRLVRNDIFLKIYGTYYDKNLRPPIIEGYFRNNRFQSLSDKDKCFLYNALSSITFYLFEINGYIFDTELPFVTKKGDNPKIAIVEDSPISEINGRVIFENHAAFNQSMFLSHPDRINAGGNYHFPTNTADEDYTSVNHYFKKNGIGSLTPLIYFIILNIEPELLLTRENPYRFLLVQRLFKIINKIPFLKKMEIDDYQLLAKSKDCISQICDICQISNPFKNLEIAIDLLSNKLKDFKTSSAVIQICEKAIKICIDNPFRLIYWPMQPQILGTNGDEPGIPFLFTKYSDSNSNELFFRNCTDMPFDWFRKIHSEIIKTKLLNDIFLDDTVNCPLEMLGACHCNSLYDEVLKLGENEDITDCSFFKTIDNFPFKSEVISFIKRQKK